MAEQEREQAQTFERERLALGLARGSGRIGPYEATRALSAIDALLRENEELRRYLHMTADADGTHHRDWIADCQSYDAEDAEIRAAVGASGLCVFRSPHQSAPCDLPIEQHCAVALGCTDGSHHPFTPESTLDAVKRMAAMVVTDEACERLAAQIALETTRHGYVHAVRLWQIIKQARGAKPVAEG